MTPTPIVRLRALEPEDLELLYTIENDPSLWQVGGSPAPLSRFALRRYLSAEPQNFFESGELRLVILDEANEAVGLVDLTAHSPLDRRAEVGIALLSAARGKGLGRAALSEIEEYARRYLQIRMLYALVSAETSPASFHAFLSTGYTKSATLPEWHFRDGCYENVFLLIKKIEK